jgi:hypothetical protein
MARIDRRVSLNQAALWTIYELVDAQAVRVHAYRPLSPHCGGWLDCGLRLAVATRRAVEWLRRVRHTRGDRPGQAQYGRHGTGTEHGGRIGRIRQGAPGRGTLLEALALAWVEC